MKSPVVRKTRVEKAIQRREDALGLFATAGTQLQAAEDELVDEIDELSDSIRTLEAARENAGEELRRTRRIGRRIQDSLA